jgi:hypothetical protein
MLAIVFFDGDDCFEPSNPVFSNVSRTARRGGGVVSYEIF